MRKSAILVLALSAACGSGGAAAPSPAGAPYPGTFLLQTGLRNKFKWPFASDSIWNVPIGSEATYLPAGIGAAAAMGMTVDEDVIVQPPSAPLKPVVVNDAGWDRAKTRCGSLRTSQLVYPEPLPVPADFTTDPGYLGSTPNMSAAILLPDGQTVRQTQPFHVWGAGGTVTNWYDGRDTTPGYR